MNELFIKKVIGKIYSYLPVFDKNRDLSKTIIIAGSGRSGTTWLGELINHKNDYRILFETFNRRFVSLISHLSGRQYINPKVSNGKLYDSFKQIASGSYNNSWINSHNKNLFPKKRMLKEIAINLMLKWIKVNFSEIPIIYIIRNPYSIAKSRMKLNWGCSFHDFTSQKDLMKDHLYAFEDLIFDNTLSMFEKNILYWCIEQYIPLIQLEQGDACIVFYENLVHNPKDEILKVANFLGLDNKELSNLNFQKTSRTTSLKAQKKEDYKIGRSQEILERFGLDKIYSNPKQPVYPKFR
jgi:hypothetical protein